MTNPNLLSVESQDAATKPSTASVPRIAPKTTANATLHEQVDVAMHRLMSVSSDYKDLVGMDKQVSTREETVAMMQHYLARLNLQAKVKQLSVVHVAGTKGKGSTCAMVESMLRHAGYKTGLFTSPHLISPCERFRINGQPISETMFLQCFDRIWTGLEQTATADGVYPPMAWFFRFLTLMALDLFVQEQVDVAILEVGLGGRLDATNVIEKPVVCGITTLDLDHTRVLGSTIDRIAYEKAGIFKPGVPAFTMAQEPIAMEMLLQCASETKTPLTQAPSIDAIGPDGASCQLDMHGAFQRANAGIAVALANTWLQRHEHPVDITTPTVDFDFTKALVPALRGGLEHAFWPARAHIMHDPSVPRLCYYIDGAHTPRSLECCAKWFATDAEPGVKRALVFTIHHERDVAAILQPLLAFPWDRVYMCRTASSRPSVVKVPTVSEALQHAHLIHLLERFTNEQVQALDSCEPGAMQWPITLAHLWHALEPDAPTLVQAFGSTTECLDDLRATPDDDKWDVLVTGSLYLAGEVLESLKWSEGTMDDTQHN